MILLCAGINAVGHAQSSGDYRSRATGNWGTAASWDTYNGTAWVAASAAPTSASGIVTIQNGHIITVNNNATIDQVVVQTGGQLTIANNNNTLTLADGAGTDLSVFGKVLYTSGNITQNGSIIFESGSQYEQTLVGAAIPTATWNANSL